MTPDRYNFVFPMVVGPRYNPPSVADDTANITNPTISAGSRAGHVDLKLYIQRGIHLGTAEQFCKYGQ